MLCANPAWHPLRHGHKDFVAVTLLRKSGATCFWLARAVANVIMRDQRTLFLSRRLRSALVDELWSQAARLLSKEGN